jgi:hypothetical protein
MARIRQIKPDFFRSEDVAGLDMVARLLFVGLWTLADREGRLLDRPRRIAVELFPYDRMDEKIDLLLGSLAARGLIVRYTRAGAACIQITGFHKHQKPHPKEPASDLPPPPAECECGMEEAALADINTQNRGETRLATDEETAENVLQPPSSVVLDPCSGSLGSGERPPGSVTAKPDRPAAQSGPGILSAFGSRWEKANRKPFFKAPFDDRAANDLAEWINDIPDPDGRAKAWAEIGPTIDVYLLMSKPSYAGHPFSAFAKDISALRTGSAVPVAPASPYRKLPPIPPGVAPPPRPRP